MHLIILLFVQHPRVAFLFKLAVFQHPAEVIAEQPPNQLWN
ncbi:hypothetical protein [Jeotgalibacillus soli]|uniref:Uncharacterized protein n=1 Tax=Jeotgalibacillus soli TaxID=889306 RepID=A0A0C2VN45_9BACL|nr:hypothetical protein [Jeotgalibacillus soli]KIL45428.1 hypothetical protein KP78_29720 [Jeotgalibacillus soli]